MAIETGRRHTGELLAEISNMVVGVYADCLGRGPTKARSFIDDDVVLCLLEDTLTKAERTLQDSGREERLLELRASLQETMHDSLIAGMERVMGRPVEALISGYQVNPDVVSEVFILGRRGSPENRPASEDDGGASAVESVSAGGLLDEGDAN